MWEKGTPDPKRVEKCDAWVTLTWFVVGRKEIMQQRHYCTCTRFIFHWAPTQQIFPAPHPAMGYTAGEQTQTELLTANQKSRDSSG